MKKLLISTCVVLSMIGCEDIREDESTSNPSSNKHNNSDPTTEIIFKDRNSSQNSDKPTGEYSYIPTGSELTQRMAYRFLNMSTFGSTPALADELRAKGIVAWVDEQLNMEYNFDKQSTLLKSLKWLQKIQPNHLNQYTTEKDNQLTKEGAKKDPPSSIKEILGKNDKILKKYNLYELAYVQSSIMDGLLRDKAQLRQKVAYSLSQIIIASESVDKYFFYKATALAYYYDLLLKHSFDGYTKLLYDVSLSPAMSVFMTYNGSRKTYTKNGQIITPDENYGREIMQKFTIGLNKLSIDGMEYSNGTDFKQNYTQDDVNTMSRVFTGLNTRLSQNIYLSDNLNPIECNMDYHDSAEKTIFGKTIPAGQSCEQDVKSAIDILVHHDSAAPFIVKKLIMRLTKSNPKNAYIQRVAEVFQDNGAGKVGDLKAVVRAILLDPDIWDDIKNGHMTKIREPYVAYINALRVLDVKPLDKFRTYSKTFGSQFRTDSNISIFSNQIEFNPDNHYKMFAQSPLRSPNIFNFYSDEFTPNDNEFRSYNHVAPEIEIQTTRVMINFSKRINYLFKQDRTFGLLTQKDKEYNIRYSYNYTDKVSIDRSSIYNDVLTSIGNLNNIPGYLEPNAKKVYEKIVGVIVDSTSKKVLGMRLDDEKRDTYIKHFSNPQYVKSSKGKEKEAIYLRMIDPILKYILLSDDYRVN